MGRQPRLLLLLASVLILAPIMCDAETPEEAGDARVLYSDEENVRVLHLERYSGMSSVPSYSLDIYGDGRVSLTRGEARPGEASPSRKDGHLASADIESLLDAAAESGLLELDTQTLRELQIAAGRSEAGQDLVSDLGGYLLEINLLWYQPHPGHEGVTNLEHRIVVKDPRYYADRYPAVERFSKLASLVQRLETLVARLRSEAATDEPQSRHEP